MNLIYKLPKWLRWILLPFVSFLTILLVNILGKLAAKILLFLSNPGGWSENFFEFFLNPGIAGFCAVYIAMAFAPKNKKFVGYAAAFVWIAIAGALPDKIIGPILTIGTIYDVNLSQSFITNIRVHCGTK